jgi:hypothetical protein
MPVMLAMATKLAGGVAMTSWTIFGGALVGLPIIRVGSTPLVGAEFGTSPLAFAFLLTGSVSTAFWYGARRQLPWFRHIGAAYWYVVGLSGYAISEWLVNSGIDPLPPDFYFSCGLFGMITFFYMYLSPGVRHYLGDGDLKDEPPTI